MGRILQFFELNQANSSRKLRTNRRSGDAGLEAPRNSLEFPGGYKRYPVVHQELPAEEQPTNMKYSPSGIPIKKLIDEEMENRMTARRNAPSVVARLMGMDPLPSEITPSFHAKETKNEKPGSSISGKEHNRDNAVRQLSPNPLLPMKTKKQEKMPYGSDVGSSDNPISLRLKKPHPREHPQEELLQQFKKDFEAWQTSKLWERSKFVDLGLERNESQIIAQENLNREKMARYARTKKKGEFERKGYASSPQLKIDARGGGSLGQYSSKPYRFGSNNSIMPRYREKTKSYDFERLPIEKLDENQERPSSPTRIVILKPGSERSDEVDESLSGSSEILDREDSMREFLEEVKERLKKEMQGKHQTTATRVTITPELSSSENYADPKQIARHIAKQVRDSVSRDLGTTLIRSESTRSYRSEIRLTGSDSPEFIDRGTRRLLSERLKNIFKNETTVDIPLNKNVRPESSSFDGIRSAPRYYLSKNGKKFNYREERNIFAESKVPSFRCEPDNVISDDEAVSPRNLVRSFSAPVSGTEFEKLILDDQHTRNGAHAQRKEEVSAHKSPEIRKSKKENFNLKGKVSHLRHNLNIKGKLFGKKIHSVEKLVSDKFDPTKALMTAPSVITNLGAARENSTEVPPSPASVSSSSPDELCRPGHPSPVSPLEVPFIEDQQSLQVSGELSIKLPALPEETMATEVAEDISIGQLHTDAVLLERSCIGQKLEFEDSTEPSIKDILATAGDDAKTSFEKPLLNLDAGINPISRWVFEEICSKQGQANDGHLITCGDATIGNKLLLDLINEALPSVLGTSTYWLTYKKRTLDSLPYGNTFLDDLLHRIHRLAHPSVDETHLLDSVVSWDLKMTPWCNNLVEDIGSLGTRMGVMIYDDIIDELVRDMCKLE